MQPQRNLQSLQNVFSPKHPMIPPHVQKFNGEYIRRPPHLLRAHQQRHSMLLLPPPFDHGSERLNRRERSLAQHAQQIHVRVTGNIISRRHRPIKNRRQQIRSRRRPHPLHKFVKQFFRSHHSPLTPSQLDRRASRPSSRAGTPGSPLPTSARPPPARTPTAQTPKSAPSKAASAPPTAKAPKTTSTISATAAAAQVAKQQGPQHSRQKSRSTAASSRTTTPK